MWYYCCEQQTEWQFSDFFYYAVNGNANTLVENVASHLPFSAYICVNVVFVHILMYLIWCELKVGIYSYMLKGKQIQQNNAPQQQSFVCFIRAWNTLFFYSLPVYIWGMPKCVRVYDGETICDVWMCVRRLCVLFLFFVFYDIAS